MEVSCPHCKAKRPPEVIEVADLTCTVCALCKAVLGTARTEAPAPEPLEAEALLLEEVDAPAAVEFEPAPTPSDPAPAQFDDVLSLPEESAEVPAPVADTHVLVNVFEVEPPAQPFTASADEPERPEAAHAEGDSEQHPLQAPPDAAPFPAPAARPAPDGYAVGLRVLRIAPVWLLLSSVGFLSVLLLLSWASQPVPQSAVAAQPSPRVEKNEATNSAPPQAEPARPAQQPAAPAAEPAKPTEPAKPAEPAPAAPESKPAAQGNFTVQVGSYKDASEANARVSQLRAAGFEADSAAVEIPSRGLWHRVYSGRAATREEAARLAAQLRAKGAASQVMVTELSRQ